MHASTSDPVKQPDRPKLLQAMGPGLITGASDDDPSGIATYSQIGAKFGYGLAWTLLLSYPLMVAIQEISARIGRVTGYGIVGLLLIANIIKSVLHAYPGRPRLSMPSSPRPPRSASA